MSFDDDINDYHRDDTRVYDSKYDSDYSGSHLNTSPTPPLAKKKGRIENVPLFIAFILLFFIFVTVGFVLVSRHTKRREAETAKVTAHAFARELVMDAAMPMPVPVPPSLKKTSVVITNGGTKLHVLEILHSGKDRLSVEVVTNEGE